MAKPADEDVTVLGKTFRILNVFTHRRSSWTITELVEMTDIPKSTLHRIVQRLLEFGALQRQGDRLTIGVRLFELGMLVPLRELREIAIPFMEDLHRATGEVVQLAVLDGTEVVYLEKLSSRSPVTAPARVGARMPAPTTGVGKAILAYSPPGVVEQALHDGLPPNSSSWDPQLESQLEQIRRRGIAYDLEDTAPGVACAAAPIFSPDKQVVAGLSVMTPAKRMDSERTGTAVQTVALIISRALGGAKRPWR